MPTLVVRHLFDGRRTVSPAELAFDATGRVVSVRRARKGQRVRDALLVPGLVNAHAHLQLPALTQKPAGFVPWIGAVMARRSAMDARALAAATRVSLHDLLASGCTAVGEIDSTGSSPSVLARAGVPGRCYQEVTGFDLDADAARVRVRERLHSALAPATRGLSPHAPYSVSADLFAEASRRSRHLAVHTAELEEEQQLLRTGRGPLRELLTAMGKLPERWRPPGVGAVAWLERLGVLRRGTLLVHCQHLVKGDAERIAASDSAIAVCPGTIAYFGREAPPVLRWLELGIPVALGTDSRASNDGLDMRRELRRALDRFRGLSPLQVLTAATSAGGKALGMPGLGRLRRGSRADFALAACDDESPDLAIERFVRGESALLGTWMLGRRTKGVQSAGAKD